MSYEHRFEPPEIRDDYVRDEDLIDRKTGRQGLHNRFFEDGRDAQLDKFRERFPNYNPPEGSPFK